MSRDVEKMKVLISELRGDQVSDDMEYAGQLRVRSGDYANDLPRVVGVELGRFYFYLITWD